ncbi:hypothetical protein ONR57_22970 [Hoyosella sp. YIM 151337]|uniref:hypothetical protein n=1 Tax=Hoyosella sp. YIM 151337 TaxID=2992742 RepID=UPI0022366C6B|nr:hypothetical protein [Hoyosella sp. YIM 151337]MCW4356173.1 hypothetical protein [Hoyosella sp. YIM 151337]
MKTYSVTVTETQTICFTVGAATPEEAGHRALELAEHHDHHGGIYSGFTREAHVHPRYEQTTPERNKR